VIVTCREKVTSPIAEEVGMKPDLECGERFEIGPFPPEVRYAVIARCPRGHQFYVDLRRP